MTNYSIETRLTPVKYLALVESIADNYFEIDGEYAPHRGFLNVIRLFYNICVVFDNPDDKSVAIDVSDLDDIVFDKEFMQKFYDSLYEDGICFGNAYRQALDIVDNKKHSVVRLGDQIKEMIIGFASEMNQYINSDSLDKIAMIANKIENNQLSAEAIVDAYANSERFQQVVNDQIPKAEKQPVKKKTATKKRTSKVPDLKVVESNG